MWFKAFWSSAAFWWSPFLMALYGLLEFWVGVGYGYDGALSAQG